MRVESDKQVASKKGSRFKVQGSKTADWHSLATGHWPLATSAFTLVELLVVIIIIGMLAALLLVAVQGARSRARVTQCSNNQREIGSAIIQYDTAKRRLPGYINRVQDTQASGANPYYRVVSWAVMMLPSLGRQDLWDGETGTDGWRNGRPAANVCTRVRAFICPDAGAEDATALSYVVNVGPYLGYNADGTTAIAQSNVFFNGVFRNMVPTIGSLTSGGTGTITSLPVSLSSIKSLSQRPMLSEARYPIQALNVSNYTPAYYTDENLPTSMRVWSDCYPEQTITTGTTTNYLTAANFASENLTGWQLGFPWSRDFNVDLQMGELLPPIHAGIVIVTFCDGHVESVNINAQCSAYDTSEIR